MSKFVNPTKVVTGVCTFSYLNCWEPKVQSEGGKPKYSVSLLIPKSDTKTVEKIKAAVQAAYDEGQSKLKGNGSPYRLSLSSRPRFVTAILSAPMMIPTRAAGS